MEGVVGVMVGGGNNEAVGESGACLGGWGK